MLGFSLQKIAVLIAILGAVWWGYKWLSRFEQIREAKERLQAKAGGGGKKSQVKVEEMTECPHCRTFQVADPSGNCGHCGRPL